MAVYLVVFSAGVLLGLMIMGLFVALVKFKDACDDW
jgi:hypothetical protein